MIGTSSNVSDNVRTTGGNPDVEFISVSNVQRSPVSVFSEFDLEGEFNDAGNPTPLNVGVSHKAFAWSEAGHRRYVIVEYTIQNNSGSTLSALYAGLFADWDITAGFASNKGGTVEDSRLGYVYDTQTGGVWAGMQVVSTSGGFIHNAMFNNAADDPGGTGVYPNSNYDTGDKYASLSTMSLTSGGSSGADVSNVVSTGPFDLASGESVTVAFSIMAGDDLADITKTADSAYIKYNGVSLPSSIEKTEQTFVSKIYPNPNDGKVTVIFGDALENNAVRLSLHNLVGQEVLNEQVVSGQREVTLDLDHLTKGAYFLTVSNEDAKKSFKIIVQ
ncbi:MAG: T9SS type A sorting domain-containing protein [Flavobacteriales bacterium]|nr:T9SS type A sorting domain-containing protein [Flavobacteriales bacterium]